MRLSWFDSGHLATSILFCFHRIVSEPKEVFFLVVQKVDNFRITVWKLKLIWLILERRWGANWRKVRGRGFGQRKWG